VSVEDTLVRMNEDRNPPVGIGDYVKPLWVSKPQPTRRRARQLAELAVHAVEAAYPKAIAVSSAGAYRGVVYAGRRSRREAAKGSK
jgi:hypothetical protein